MITPHVTEIPLRLEPTSHDPFLDGAPTAAPAPWELDDRRNDGADLRRLGLVLTSPPQAAR